MAQNSVQNIEKVSTGDYKGNFLVTFKNFPIENLVFEGGGPKGVVYLGAAKALEEHNLLENIKNVAGSSAGAITAFLIALGYDYKQLKDIFYNLDFTNLLDFTDKKTEEPTFITDKLIAALKTVTKDANLGRGIFLGNKLLDTAKELIATQITEIYQYSSNFNNKHLSSKNKEEVIKACLLKTYPKIKLSSLDDAEKTFVKNSYSSNKLDSLKTLLNGDINSNLNKRHKFISSLSKKEDITFEDLKNLKNYYPEFNIRDLSITGTNYTDASLSVFNVKNTPTMPIALAVRISASLPIFFKTVIYNNKEYMDGGVFDNYPMQIFDDPYYLDSSSPLSYLGSGANVLTLGFKVDSFDEIRNVFWNADYSKSYLSSKIADLVSGMHVRDQDKKTYEKYSHRTVQINDLNYSTFGFDISDKDKDALSASGYKDSIAWLHNYYLDTGIGVIVENAKQLKFFVNDKEYEEILKLFGNVFE